MLPVSSASTAWKPRLPGRTIRSRAMRTVPTATPRSPGRSSLRVESRRRSSYVRGSRNRRSPPAAGPSSSAPPPGGAGPGCPGHRLAGRVDPDSARRRWDGPSPPPPAPAPGGQCGPDASGAARRDEACPGAPEATGGCHAPAARRRPPGARAVRMPLRGLRPPPAAGRPILCVEGPSTYEIGCRGRAGRRGGSALGRRGRDGRLPRRIRPRGCRRAGVPHGVRRGRVTRGPASSGSGRPRGDCVMPPSSGAARSGRRTRGARARSASCCAAEFPRSSACAARSSSWTSSPEPAARAPASAVRTRPSSPFTVDRRAKSLCARKRRGATSGRR